MTEKVKPVRVRFAPSPTGHVHLGSGRTALYNYLLARQTGGTFILRIEDTDQKRFVPGSERELIDSLHWLGVQWDEGPDVGGPHAPYHQSERKAIYQEYANQLIESGQAFYCFCSAERLDKVRQAQMKAKAQIRYDGACRSLSRAEAAARVAAGEKHVIRFKMPTEGSITVHDHLRGDISVENRNLDDYIIVKSDGLALYHLAAMVDDHLMEITHVIRGSEWLSTFPLHGHILRAFGWEMPVFIHLSVFLKPSGKGKMSKREAASAKLDGYSIFIEELRDMGFIPEGVCNWIALMGWSYDDHTEIFSLADLVEKFSIDHLNPSPAAINFSKLDHFNGLHIRNLAIEDLAERLKPFFEAAGYTVSDEKLLAVTPLLQKRIVTLEEAPEMGGFFFVEEVNPAPEELVGRGMTPADSLRAARSAYTLLEGLPALSHEAAEQPLRDLAAELAIEAGQLFSILRVAVTGQTVSPPLLESMEVLSKAETLKRLQKAIEMLKGM